MGVYKNKKDGHYYIDYYVEGHRRREKVGPSKTQAQNALMKRKVQIAEGKFFDVKNKQLVVLEDYANEYLKFHSANKRSGITDGYHVKTILKFFKHRKYLHQITADDIDSFKVKRATEVSQTTVNRELTTLKTMFKKAVEREKIEKNPAKNIKKYREANSRVRYLEKEEIKALLEQCEKSRNKHLTAMVKLALNTGMRQGEIFNLKWSEVDFNNEILYLLETKNSELGKVYLNETAKEVLAGVKKHKESPYVFHGRGGKPYTDIRGCFYNALENVGIADFHFHDLRHTFASQLAMRGVPIFDIKELLRHKDIRQTMIYAHLGPKHLKRSSRTLDSLFEDRKLRPDGHLLDTQAILMEAEKIAVSEGIAQEALV